MAQTDSLSNVPDHISPRFLPDYVNLSQKCIAKATSYFTEGYIHNIQIRVSIYLYGYIIRKLILNFISFKCEYQYVNINI
jgi:hypothetical protein